MELSGDNSWEQRGKIDGLMYVIEVYSDIVAFALTAIAVTAIVWAVRHKLLKMHPVGLVLLVVGGLVYLAMPRILFATYMADQRLPVALAFMILACAHLEMRHRLVRRGFLAFLLILLVVRVIEVDVDLGRSLARDPGLPRLRQAHQEGLDGAGRLWRPLRRRRREGA